MIRRCRNCGGIANRPRSLCWSCYYRPGVRGLYPPVTRAGAWGLIGHEGGRNRFVVPPPPGPTTALPGSLAKVLVLQARAALGVALWHPEDRQEYQGGRAADVVLAMIGRAAA